MAGFAGRLGLVTHEDTPPLSYFPTFWLYLSFGDPYDTSANLTDVLADLMHVSIRQPELGLKFQDRLEMARQHFEAEMEEEL